jgi:hypothetical protein
MPDTNPFEAPAAALEPTPRAERTVVPVATQPFFAVGVRKLWIMTIVTFGLYTVFWFERHFRFQKRLNGEDSWPVLRAIFAVLFAQDLFLRVAANSAAEPPWQASRLAWQFGLSAVFGNVMSRIPGDHPVTAWLSALSVVGIGLATTRCQAVVNTSLRDQGFTSDLNEGLSVLNWLAILVGGTLLLVSLLDLFMRDV